jgi:polyhydroxyalkanoate synthesis regulator protein
VSGVVVIKRYGKSRLYHAAALRYVSVADLGEWRRRGVAFVVIDAESGQDVTRILLA